MRCSVCPKPLPSISSRSFPDAAWAPGDAGALGAGHICCSLVNVVHETDGGLLIGNLSGPRGFASTGPEQQLIYQVSDGVSTAIGSVLLLSGGE